jgi:hypothetical protein
MLDAGHGEVSARQSNLIERRRKLFSPWPAQDFSSMLKRTQMTLNPGMAMNQQAERVREVRDVRLAD